VELGGGSKKHVEDHMTRVVEILAESEVVESCTLGTLRIHWVGAICMMY